MPPGPEYTMPASLGQGLRSPPMLQAGVEQSPGTVVTGADEGVKSEG